MGQIKQGHKIEREQFDGEEYEGLEVGSKPDPTSLYEYMKFSIQIILKEKCNPSYGDWR